MSEPDLWLEQFNARREARRERSEADRTLVVDGERLTVKPAIAPEVAFALSDLQARLTVQLAEHTAAEAAGQLAPPWELTDRDMVDTSETTIRACLDEESLEAWKRLRSPDHPDPLTVNDIWAIAFRLVAKASETPTDAPVASTNGRAPTAASSPAASPSRASKSRRSPSRST